MSNITMHINRIYKSHDEWPPEVFICTDGASRGNPGPASLGIVIFDTNRKPLLEAAHRLGEQTNNFAEYTAVLMAFKLCIDCSSLKKIHLFSDSEFLIKQLQGKYKVKAANIKPLFKECIESLQLLQNKNISVTLTHIPREKNKTADALANEALDLA